MSLFFCLLWKCTHGLWMCFTAAGQALSIWLQRHKAVCAFRFLRSFVGSRVPLFTVAAEPLRFRGPCAASLLWVASLGGGALDLPVLLLAACWPLLTLWTTTSSRWTSCSGRLRLGGGLRPNFFLEVFLADFLGGVKPLPRPRDRRLPGGGLHPRGAHDGREEG